MLRKMKGFEKRRPAGHGVRNLFHGVAIETPRGAKACPAVARIAGERYLSEDAPALPLPDCETPHECRCVYQHFIDRRTDRRREADEGLPNRYVDTDRRLMTRRVTDRR
jgi:hypothetical protein